MKGMLISAFMLSFLFASCQSGTGTNPEVLSGSPVPITEVTGWTAHIDTTYFDATTRQLVAKGGIVNEGTTDIITPCQMEGFFYSDGSCETKLGSARAAVSPLVAGEEAQWSLRFSSADKDLSQYPDFAVADFHVTARNNQK